ncbi:hypothetical protein ABI59_15995 [Acidobacteria bacterium Mor1]|nr:hypothetical protein ABI59_15995 [Acidobacteria bacterium Mor1]
MPSEDRKLVRRLLAGDERAFDAFFDEYFPRLYRFVLRRTQGDEDAAEEIAQAALSQAIRKLATYRGEAALFTWLCTFCRFEMSARYRKSRRSPDAVELAEDDQEIRAALESLWAGMEAGPHADLERNELVRRVHAALDHLPGRYGAVLEWKYIEGISMREIAGRLGIGEKAVESTLTRARNAFRQAFSELCRAGQ